MPVALVLYDPDYARSAVIGVALARCFKQRGLKTTLARQWNGKVQHDVCAAYGWRWADAFLAHQTYFYVDLGWWNRRPHPRKITGHHKIVQDRRHEMPDLSRRWPEDRLKKRRIPIGPWRGTPIRTVLLAAMSDKAALTSGFAAPGDWCRGAATLLLARGLRVIYRPKPGACCSVQTIDGCERSDPNEQIETALARVDAVVSHHSNVCVDALVAGLPAYRTLIDHPIFPTGLPSPGDTVPEPPQRHNYLRALAYRQWTPDEMEHGAWLDHYDLRVVGR